MSTLEVTQQTRHVWKASVRTRTPSPASSASRFAQLLGAAEDYMTFVKMLKAHSMESCSADDTDDNTDVSYEDYGHDNTDAARGVLTLRAPQAGSETL